MALPKLRWYQSEAVNAALAPEVWKHRRRMIVLPTGAGKSLVCAELADQLAVMHMGSKILMLVPTQDLVLQNLEKLGALGVDASVWCSSLGAKKSVHQIIIGTPKSFYNHLGMFTKGQVAALIMDECHLTHPTNLAIVEALANANEQFFTIGMTATPWRTGDGWVYGDHCYHGVTPADAANDPFFEYCCYEVTPYELIADGYLCPPSPTHQLESYDEEGLQQSNGQYTAQSLDRMVMRQTNRTERIIKDVIKNSASCRSVIIFAASKRHAKLILDILPEGQATYVDGSMHAAERRRALESFKSFECKYIVNVNILTTGFDHPAVDHVVIMRPMESSLLWLQMVGRGCRIYPGKDSFLISDYGGNVAAFFPHGDIYDPEIKCAMRWGEQERIEFRCPKCNHENSGSILAANSKKPRDDYGWLLDLAGDPIELDFPYVSKKGELISEFRRVPASALQRCCGIKIIDNKRVQCDFMWNFKRCHCGHQNSLSAKTCGGCGEIIQDASKKLKEHRAQIMEVRAIAREEAQARREEVKAIQEQDPHQPRRAPVDRVTLEWYVTRKQQRILLAKIKLPKPLGTVPVYLKKGTPDRRRFLTAIFGMEVEKDADIMRMWNSRNAWTQPNQLHAVWYRIPRAKKGYPEIKEYEIE